MWSKPNFKIFVSYGDITYLLKELNFPSNMTFLVIFNDIFVIANALSSFKWFFHDKFITTHKELCSWHEISLKQWQKFRFWSKKRQNSKLSTLQTACMHFLALYSSFMTIHKTYPLGKIPDMPKHCFKIIKQSNFWLILAFRML